MNDAQRRVRYKGSAMTFPHGLCRAAELRRSATSATQPQNCHGLKKRAASTQHRPAAGKTAMSRLLITIRTITTQKRAPKKDCPFRQANLGFGAFPHSHRRSVSFTWSRMGHVAPELKASYVQLAGRLDYTAVVKQSDGQGVWSCEHITHHDPSSATECARREVARRTDPQKGSQR
jgi:hypothetical protein